MLEPGLRVRPSLERKPIERDREIVVPPRGARGEEEERGEDAAAEPHLAAASFFAKSLM